MSGPYWNIKGKSFAVESYFGEREITVSGRRGEVCFTCDPDDDRQAVQIVQSPDEWEEVAREIIRVCAHARAKATSPYLNRELRTEKQARQDIEEAKS